LSQAEIYDYYVLFPNHHEGLRLQKELKAAGIKCTIAPTPREASSFCGISLRITEEDLEPVKQMIERHSIKVDGIARIRRKAAIWNKSC